MSPLTGPCVVLDGRVRGADGIGRCTRSIEAALAEGVVDARSVKEPDPNPYGVESMRRLLEIADSIEADVVHTLDYKTPLDAGDRPVVATVHDLIRVDRPELCYDDDTFAERFGTSGAEDLERSVAELRSARTGGGTFRSAHHEYYTRMMRHTLASAAHVVFDSRTTMRRAEAFQPLGGRGSWCHLGVRPSAVPQKPRRRDSVVYVGQDRPHKRVELLREAFDLLRRRRPDATLTLVGRDFDARTASEPGVLHAGEVDDDSLSLLLESSEVLVQLSSYEGFGLTPLEAMAAGMAVVVSDLPVFRETLGSSAEFVDATPTAVANGLERALGSGQDRSGERRDHARRFSWTTYTDHLVEIWRAVA